MPRACSEGWLDFYVKHMRFSEAPASFHFWVGVGTIAGALRRKVWTDHLTYQYTPNFYIVLVAPPGIATKSTAIRYGISMLRQIKGVHLGPQSLTWQALLESLKQSTEAVKVPGSEQVLVYSALTLGISELGTFLRPENREYLDHLTNIWDAQKEMIGKKTVKDGEISIENPWLNIMAGTTPGWLRDNFPKVLVEGGLASRIIFVYEDNKQQLIAYPELLNVSERFKLEHEALLYDLQQIANLAGQYKFTDAAYAWGTDWYEKLHERRRKMNGISAKERYTDLLSRKQALIHKLAIILAASKRDDLVLDVDDLSDADKHVSALENNLNFVFDSIGVSNEAALSMEIINTIKRTGGVSYRSLFQAYVKTIDGATYKRIITHALEAGVISREPMNGDYMLRFVGERRTGR